MASHCIPFRQRAALQLSRIVNLHFGGKCKVPSNNENETNNDNNDNATTVVVTQLPPSGRQEFVNNSALYSNYKYCLTMENKASKGYMTEKLLNAFMGGCLPIYYGTRGVLEIFNPKAFCYYIGLIQ
jgi:hypothetical protein